MKKGLSTLALFTVTAVIAQNPAKPTPSPAPAAKGTVTRNPTATTTPASGPSNQRKPDLFPFLTRPMSAHLLVRNAGTGPAGASKLTVECHKAGHAGAGNGCPEVPSAYAASYSDAAFPGKIVVHVPPLAPGASWTHALPFWKEMKWTHGKYDFKATADAGNTVVELNEANNTVTSTLTGP